MQAHKKDLSMHDSHRCLPLRCVHCWELEGQGARGRGYHAESTIIMARATLKRAMLAARPRVIILANVGNPRCLHLRVALACAELMHAEERRKADKTTAHRPLELPTAAHHRLLLALRAGRVAVARACSALQDGERHEDHQHKDDSHGGHAVVAICATGEGEVPALPRQANVWQREAYYGGVRQSGYCCGAATH